MSDSFAPAALAESSREAAGLRSRPGRGRAGGLAATVAGLALLAAAAGCSSGGGDQKASGPPKGLQVPAQIASLKKAADQSAAKFLLSGMQAAVRKKIRAVSYQDGSSSSRKVLVFGGLGLPVPPGDDASKLKQMLSSFTSTSAKIGNPTSVESGSAGGKAECAALPTAKAYNCGWINGKAALVMTFQGFDQHSAQTLVPQILSAMVRT